jgi:hypothetical protein
MAIIGLAVLSWMAPRSAWAWDGLTLWNQNAASATPGGGGILGTGSTHDYGITCAHCHIQAEGKIDVAFTFTPPLPTVGGQDTYEPGQKYQVDVKLVGEHLGLGTCPPGGYNNNVVATFEDAFGNVAGALASDSGQSSASCPPTAPTKVSGTTATFGDCRAVFSAANAGTTDWTFTWTAPPKMSGPVILFYGAVDGNCDMMSMNDDVRVGAKKLGEAMAMGPIPPGGESPATRTRVVDATGFVGLLPLGLGLVVARRRQRRGAAKAST